MVERNPAHVENEHSAVRRRDFIKRTAIVGGSLLWAGPVVQSLTPMAYAHVVSPANSCCCECRDSMGTLMACGSSTNFTGDAMTFYTGGSSSAACNTFCTTAMSGLTGTVHCGPGVITCSTAMGSENTCTAH